MRFLARLRLALVVAGVCCLTLGVLAAPASAHGRGSESTNFVSAILKTPDLPGVTWEVYGGDQYLAVTNTSDTELVVLDYEPEPQPYLRVGPDGVFENAASKATYLNTDRYAEVGAFPPNVGPENEPRWRKISDEPTYAWHDHNIHWMSPTLPPIVVDAAHRTSIKTWKVPFIYDGADQAIEGELLWVPPPSPLPWLAGAFVLTAAALLGLRKATGQDWIRPLVRPAAIVLLVVSVLNITHLVDDFLAVPAPFATQLISGLQTALFIALGLFGAIVSLRGRDGAFTALGVGAGGVFVGQGVLYWDALTKTSSASVFPGWLARAVVSLSIAQALWVGAIAVIGNRRLAQEDEQRAAAGGEVVAT